MPDREARAMQIEADIAAGDAARRADSDDALGRIEALLMKLCQQLLDKGSDDGDAPAADDGDAPAADAGKPRPLASDAAFADPAKEAAKEEQLGEAQQRADAVAMSWGKRADMPMMGETPRSYRIRQARRFQQYSPSYAKADLRLIADPHAFDAAEAQIYSDAVEASRSNDTVAPGLLREVRRKDQSGREITQFYGSIAAALEPFRLPVYRVKRINKNPDRAYG